MPIPTYFKRHTIGDRLNDLSNQLREEDRMIQCSRPECEEEGTYRLVDVTVIVGRHGEPEEVYYCESHLPPRMVNDAEFIGYEVTV